MYLRRFQPPALQPHLAISTSNRLRNYYWGNLTACATLSVKSRLVSARSHRTVQLSATSLILQLSKITYTCSSLRSIYSELPLIRNIFWEEDNPWPCLVNPPIRLSRLVCTISTQFQSLRLQYRYRDRDIVPQACTMPRQNSANCLLANMGVKINAPPRDEPTLPTRYQFIDAGSDTQSNSTQVRRHVMQEFTRQKCWQTKRRLDYLAQARQKSTNPGSIQD
jgi:hypothetical protein